MNESIESKEFPLTAVRRRRSIQLRQSLDNAYRSSSDDEPDERDALNHESQGAFVDADMQDKTARDAHSRHASYARERANSGGSRVVSGVAPTLAKAKRSCWRRRKCVGIFFLLFLALIAIVVVGGLYVYTLAPKDGQSPPWYPAPLGGTVPSWQESYSKAEKMVKEMTLLEKVNVTTGTGWMMDMCVGNTGPATKVGFPSLCLQDGPLGVRFADLITAFPAGLTTGATWNKDLIYKRGQALGKEFRLKGANVMLGPAMGPLGKLPAGGRNWEGFGSDPVLQGIAAGATIRGIQDEGVIATAKHYIANEQEHFRQAYEWVLPNAMSSNIDDRTLHEVYLWPFADSVRAGVGSVMCSYQLVNNSYACGNSKILNGLLKDELGFQGFVQSDWGAQKSGVGTALAGLDMSMPGDGLHLGDGISYWGPELSRAVLNGSVPLTRLNDAVTRIVATWYQLGQDDKTKFPGPNFSSWTKDKTGLLHPGSDDETKGEVNQHKDVRGKDAEDHAKIARQVAAEGTILVKNIDSVLPLSRNGTGSTDKKLRVAIYGEDAGPGRGPNACPDRGCNQGTLASGWGSGAVDFEYLVTPLNAINKTFNADYIELTSTLTNTVIQKRDVTNLKEQDICLVFINADAGEGYIADNGIRGDRNDLFPQKGGDSLVESVAAGCAKTVVIIHAVGPVIVEKWIDNPNVKAVLLANLPGEESGNALVDVLFGDENPSGKLPYTVGKTLDDYGPGAKVLYYPNALVPYQNFSEALQIDYRYFDTHSITPRFEFGFGLSYTTFALSNLSLALTKPKSPLPSPRPDTLLPPSYPTTLPDPSTALFPQGFRKLKKYIYPYLTSTRGTKHGKYPYPKGYNTAHPPSQAGGAEGGNPSLYDIHANLSVTLTNTGTVRGKQVIQVYISFPPDVVDGDQGVDFPPKVLRAFEKVEVDAGASKQVEMALTRRDLSFWSVRLQNWVMPTEGRFGVLVGTSSRDLPLRGEL